MASAVVQPATTEEVIAIVKAANNHKMPISPISIGRNLGYGGTAPRLRGACILDLKRMNKILEVNEESAYVLVEPGVSYFNMYEHLQSIGSNLWIDTREVQHPLWLTTSAGWILTHLLYSRYRMGINDRQCI